MKYNENDGRFILSEDDIIAAKDLLDHAGWLMLKEWLVHESNVAMQSVNSLDEEDEKLALNVAKIKEQVKTFARVINQAYEFAAFKKEVIVDENIEGQDIGEEEEKDEQKRLEQARKEKKERERLAAKRKKKKEDKK